MGFAGTLMPFGRTSSPVAARYRRKVRGWTRLARAVCAGRFFVAGGSVVCVGALEWHSVLPVTSAVSARGFVHHI